MGRRQGLLRDAVFLPPPHVQYVAGQWRSGRGRGGVSGGVWRVGAGLWPSFFLASEVSLEKLAPLRARAADGGGSVVSSSRVLTGFKPAPRDAPAHATESLALPKLAFSLPEAIVRCRREGAKNGRSRTNSISELCSIG